MPKDTLRAIARFVPDNIMLLDAEGRIQFINWTVPDLTPEQVVGRHPQEFVPPQYRPAMVACLHRVRGTGQPDRFDVIYVGEDGARSRWESRVAAVRDEAGRLDGFVIVSSNVTERDAAAAERESLFDLSLDLMCVATFSGYFKRVNPAFERVLGYGPDELTSRPFIEFVHPEDREATAAAVARLIDGQAVSNFENRYLCRDGSYRTLSWAGNGEPALELIYAVARDVTEQKAIAAQLQRSQKMDAVGQLAGGVAHDFNNLMLAVQANADLGLRSVGAEASASEYFDAIKRAAARAAELTSRLMTLGRRGPMRRAPIDLGALVSGMAGMLRATIPEHVELRLDVSREQAHAQADGGQIEQVLLNLCLNARDAMARGGLIRVSCSRSEAADEVLLIVSDTGCGMTEEVRERAFEPFFTTKDAGRGNGLGLSMVYGIVEQHGGRVRIDSGPGRGTTVEVALPAASAPVHEAVTGGDEPPGGSETILVAEDSELVLETIVDVLEVAGYKVVTARDGREAVATAARHPEASLALLDVVMPGLSGPEAWERMEAGNPRLRVLFSSGYAQEAGSQIRGDLLLRKPYDVEELLVRVRSLLDQ